MDEQNLQIKYIFRHDIINLLFYILCSFINILHRNKKNNLKLHFSNQNTYKLGKVYFCYCDATCPFRICNDIRTQSRIWGVLFIVTWTVVSILFIDQYIFYCELALYSINLVKLDLWIVLLITLSLNKRVTFLKISIIKHSEI